jgi:hypothetical protein
MRHSMITSSYARIFLTLTTVGWAVPATVVFAYDAGDLYAHNRFAFPPANDLSPEDALDFGYRIHIALGILCGRKINPDSAKELESISQDLVKRGAALSEDVKAANWNFEIARASRDPTSRCSELDEFAHKLEYDKWMERREKDSKDRELQLLRENKKARVR